jgi:ornithine decarboxylase
MNLLSVKPPTIPIPLHKYLKIVAIVDATDPETKRLLDHFVVSEILEISAENSTNIWLRQ